MPVEARLIAARDAFLGSIKLVQQPHIRHSVGDRAACAHHYVNVLPFQDTRLINNHVKLNVNV
jgi:hypothetical protein